MTKLFVFAPLSSEMPTFGDAYKGHITNVASYSVTKRGTSVGEFSIVLPVPVSIVSDIKEDDILWLIDKGKKYWLIVRGLDFSTKNNTLTLTGTDIKGFFSNRITLYPPEEQDTGTFGYDVVQGTTEECCIHYVNNNVVNALDENRNIYGLVCKKNEESVGLSSDTYRTRFEPLSEVLTKLTDNARVMWDIAGDIANNKFVFSVISCVDKSIKQTDRAAVVFSSRRKNVSELHRKTSNAELKNVIYATKSGGTLESDAFTATVYRDDEIPKGIDRKEIHLNVSCEELSDIERYALHEATDYVKSDSITFEAVYPEDYGEKYDIGDIVTVVDDFGNVELTDAITAATVTSSATEYKVQLTVGFSEPKLVKKLVNKINKGAIK